MSHFPVVLTLEAAAERLLTTPDTLRSELEAGRLEGFRLGDEWRTTEAALSEVHGCLCLGPSRKEPFDDRCRDQGRSSVA